MERDKFRRVSAQIREWFANPDTINDSRPQLTLKELQNQAIEAAIQYYRDIDSILKQKGEAYEEVLKKARTSGTNELFLRGETIERKTLEWLEAEKPIGLSRVNTLRIKGTFAYIFTGQEVWDISNCGDEEKVVVILEQLGDKVFGYTHPERNGKNKS